MQKPLVRWTIGPVKYSGREILRESVRSFRRLYPEFDTVVCANHMSGEFLEWITDMCESLGVDIYEQKESEIDCLLTDSGWKLTPPRLNPAGHELWIDNDILIRSRFPEIDEWLNSSGTIVSSGHHGKVGHGGVYGCYADEIPDGIKACAGFFGLPPNFDFHRRIVEHASRLFGRSLGRLDEQGLVVAVTVNYDPCIIVPMETLAVVDWEHGLPSKLPCGIHFVGSNRSDNYGPWNEYKKLASSIPM